MSQTTTDAQDSAKALIKAVKRLTAELTSGNSTPADIHYASGQLFELENEMPKAEAAYRAAFAHDPNLLATAARLAVVLMNQAKVQEAIVVASGAVARDPDHVIRSLVRQRPLALCSVLGDAYRLAGDLEAASTMYRRAASVEKGGSYGALQAVLIYAAKGDTRSAADMIGKVSSDDLGRLGAIPRLLAEDKPGLPFVREVSRSVQVAAAEQMMFSPS